VVSVIAQGLGVGLVPAALAQAGLPGVVFRPLTRPLLPYDTHCLAKEGGRQPALQAFLDIVRRTSAALSGG
jgi:DNA-binding transcriptional LysR family regulator